MPDTRSPAPFARIEWQGDSHEVLLAFPDAVKGDLGYALWLAQMGELPPRARRMASIGPGVFELKEQDSSGWYRLVYVARIADTIHVLHCFRKQGRKTDRRDLETARARLKLVQMRHRRGGKR